MGIVQGDLIAASDLPAIITHYQKIEYTGNSQYTLTLNFSFAPVLIIFFGPTDLTQVANIILAQSHPTQGYVLANSDYVQYTWAINNATLTITGGTGNSSSGPSYNYKNQQYVVLAYG